MIYYVSTFTKRENEIKYCFGLTCNTLVGKGDTSMKEREYSRCCVVSRLKFSEINDRKQDVDFKLDLNITGKRYLKENMVYIPGGSFLMGTNDKEGFPAD